MVTLSNLKIGDLVKVNESCEYCDDPYANPKVYVGDIGTVVAIETGHFLDRACDGSWPVRVKLDGHDESYLFGLNELDYV